VICFQRSKMRIFLTVGKNPVPVLAAAYRLVKTFQLDGSPSELILVHTDRSGHEAKVIEEQLQKKLRQSEIRSPVVRMLPSERRGSVEMQAEIRNLAGNDDAHLHYTGGTKTMGIQCLTALLNGSRHVTTSYLDIDTHQVHTATGSLLDRCVLDERKEWSLALEDLAQLHGVTLSFEASANGPYGCAPGLVRTDTTLPSPAVPPTPGLIEIADRMRQVLVQNKNSETFGSWFGKYLDVVGFPKLPKPEQFLERECPGTKGNECFWPSSSKFSPSAPPGWNEIPAELNRQFGVCWQDTSNGWRFIPDGLNGVQLEGVCKFVRSHWLEVAVYSQLPKINTWNGVRLMPTHADIRCPFELDVITILGYQPVAFSVTTAHNNGKVKEKAFEVWHRVRQLGGDGARAVVVSLLDHKIARDLENDLFVDLGLDHRPLRIFSKEDCAHLPDRIREYLTTLKWSLP
jgi:hypothetical protein